MIADAQRRGHTRTAPLPVRLHSGDRYDRGLKQLRNPPANPQKRPAKTDKPEIRAGLAGGIPQWTNRGNGWLWLARIVC